MPTFSITEHRLLKVQYTLPIATHTKAITTPAKPFATPAKPIANPLKPIAPTIASVLLIVMKNKPTKHQTYLSTIFHTFNPSKATTKTLLSINETI